MQEKEIKEFLESNGYKQWASKKDNIGDCMFITEKYQKRVDFDTAWTKAPLCECNDKLLVNIEVNTNTIGGEENITWTIFLLHQSPVNDEWCDLKIYNILTDKLIDIEKFESKLREMWIVFNKG